MLIFDSRSSLIWFSSASLREVCRFFSLASFFLAMLVSRVPT